MCVVSFSKEDADFKGFKKKLAKERVKCLFEDLKLEFEFVNFVFCSDDFLYSLNLEYLKHDTLTDVITFDYSDGSSLCGDVFISIPRVLDNAKEFGFEPIVELYRVIIHACLHLAGYKDASDKQKKIMRAKEDFYLRFLGVYENEV